MPALDPSIILQGRAPQIDNPLAVMLQHEQIQGAQSRNRLADAQLQEQQRTLSDDNALRELTRNAYDSTTGTVDPAKVRAGLAQGGNFTQLQAFDTKQLAQQKSQAEAKKAQIEGHLQMFDVVGRVLSGVRDQAGYDAARAQLAEIYPDQAAKMPPVFNPQELEANRMKALPIKDQLEQQYKALTFAETQRHNQASEGLTAQGQNVTMRGQDLSAGTASQGQQIAMRGQDMVDSRTREAQAQKAAVEKAPTEFQGKSAGYGARAEEADRLIRDLDASSSPMAVNAKQAAGRVPIVGGLLETAANSALSPNNQKLEQAQRDFVNSVLRQESGAAISQSEFENAKRQYFRQPGDSDEVAVQKAANRKTAIEGFKRSAGKAAFTADGSKPKPSLADIFGN